MGPMLWRSPSWQGRILCFRGLRWIRHARRPQPLDRRVRKLTKLLDKLREEESRLGGMMACQADALALQVNCGAGLRIFAPLPCVEAGPHGPAREIKLIYAALCMKKWPVCSTRPGAVSAVWSIWPTAAALEAELASLRQARHDSLLGATAGNAEESGSGSRAPGSGMAATLPKNVQMFISSGWLCAVARARFQGQPGGTQTGGSARYLAACRERPRFARHHTPRARRAGSAPRTLDEAGARWPHAKAGKGMMRGRACYMPRCHQTHAQRPAGTVRIDKSLPSREVAVDLALEERLLPG